MTQNGTSSKLKNDMIGIPTLQSDGTVKLDTRVIVEVVNDYTFILDRPFNNFGQLASPILDFKYIGVEGPTKNKMNSSDLALHLKSFGLEILHGKIVFCQRCAFAATYSIGDLLYFVSYFSI